MTFSCCSCETNGPMVVAGSNASPTLIALAAAATPSITWSNTSRWTYRREPLTQHWPSLK